MLPAKPTHLSRWRTVPGCRTSPLSIVEELSLLPPTCSDAPHPLRVITKFYTTLLLGFDWIVALQPWKSHWAKQWKWGAHIWGADSQRDRRAQVSQWQCWSHPSSEQRKMQPHTWPLGFSSSRGTAHKWARCANLDRYLIPCRGSFVQVLCQRFEMYLPKLLLQVANTPLTKAACSLGSCGARHFLVIKIPWPMLWHSSAGNSWSQAVVQAAQAGRGWQPCTPLWEHQPGWSVTIVCNNFVREFG